MLPMLALAFAAPALHLRAVGDNVQTLYAHLLSPSPQNTPADLTPQHRDPRRRRPCRPRIRRRPPIQRRRLNLRQSQSRRAEILRRPSKRYVVLGARPGSLKLTGAACSTAANAKTIEGGVAVCNTQKAACDAANTN